MDKDDSKHFIGQPLFKQIIDNLPMNKLNLIIRETDSDRYYKRFKTIPHLILMLFGIFSKCNSMSEVCSGMLSLKGKLNHLGLKDSIAKSTAGDGLRERSHEVFQKIYFAVLEDFKEVLSVSRKEEISFKHFSIFDSTMISLFSNIMKGVGRNHKGEGKKKGGLKVHVLLDGHSEYPNFVCISEASMHDRKFLGNLKLEPHSVIVFDRAYNDYAQYAKWGEESINFVGRLKINAIYEEIQVYKDNKLPSKQPGVLKDSKIQMKYKENDTEKLLNLRKIEYQDEKDRKYQFICNNFEIKSEEIAFLYKKRWTIELVFKKIKHNFQLKYFYSETENGIKTQVWCTLIAHLLLLLISVKAKTKKAFSTICTIVRIHLISLIEVLWLIQNDMRSYTKNARKNKPPPNLQLELNFNAKI